MSLLYSVDQPISTNVEYVKEFLIFHYKKIWDLAQENVVNIEGSYGNLDQYLWMSAKP